MCKYLAKYANAKFTQPCINVLLRAQTLINFFLVLSLFPIICQHNSNIQYVCLQSHRNLADNYNEIICLMPDLSVCVDHPNKLHSSPWSIWRTTHRTLSLVRNKACPLHDTLLLKVNLSCWQLTKSTGYLGIKNCLWEIRSNWLSAYISGFLLGLLFLIYV